MPNMASGEKDSNDKKVGKRGADRRSSSQGRDSGQRYPGQW